MPRNPNRYSQIHVLFQKIAEQRVLEDCKQQNQVLKDFDHTRAVYAKAKEVKEYWKNFMGVESLTDLDDKQLQNMVVLMKSRLKALNGHDDTDQYRV